MIYRKLKLVRNFKKTIQPNKSWEGNGSRKTVKLSFSYQVGWYVHLIPWTSFTSSTEYAWCVWRPTEAKTGSSCGCVSPPHDAPIKKLQVLNTRPHLHSIKRDESFTTIVQERILRASSEQALHFEWRANARASSEARKSGGNRELSLFIPLLTHASPCACRPRVTSHNSLKLRACSQATQDAMPRSHHINRVKREKQISASSKQSFDITKAG